MKKIRKKLLVEILIGIVVITIIIIAFSIIVKNSKPNNTFESFTALGQTIAYKENKHFYFLHMKNADISAENGNCINLFEINTYDNQGYNALSHYKNGENYAYYYFNIEGSRAYNLYLEDGYPFDLTGFDYGIYIVFDEPIVIDEACQK